MILLHCSGIWLLLRHFTKLLSVSLCVLIHFQLLFVFHPVITFVPGYQWLHPPCSPALRISATGTFAPSSTRHLVHQQHREQPLFQLLSPLRRTHQPEFVSPGLCTLLLSKLDKSAWTLLLFAVLILVPVL